MYRRLAYLVVLILISCTDNSNAKPPAVVVVVLLQNSCERMMGEICKIQTAVAMNCFKGDGDYFLCNTCRTFIVSRHKNSTNNGSIRNVSIATNLKKIFIKKTVENKIGWKEIRKTTYKPKFHYRFSYLSSHKLTNSSPDLTDTKIYEEFWEQMEKNKEIRSKLDDALEYCSKTVYDF